MDEEQIWEGTPSQVLNAGTFILCFLTCWLVVPIFWALWQWLVVRNTRYQLTSERLRIRTGVFNRRFEEIELYRIKDSAYAEPFFLRLFGVGNIELTSADANTPYLVLRGIRDGEHVRQRLRKQVESMRMRMRVRNVELSDPAAFGLSDT